MPHRAVIPQCQLNNNAKSESQGGGSGSVAPFLQDLGDRGSEEQIGRDLQRCRQEISEVGGSTYSPDMPCKSHPLCLAYFQSSRYDQILPRYNPLRSWGGVGEQSVDTRNIWRRCPRIFDVDNAIEPNLVLYREDAHTQCNVCEDNVVWSTTWC
jgi:hypothetical protein